MNVYQSLQAYNYQTGTFGGDNQISLNDANDCVVFKIDATTDFYTEKFDVSNKCEVMITSSSFDGSCVVYYQKSLDGITWINELSQDLSADFSITISTNTTNIISDSRAFKGFRRLFFDTTATTGDVIIKVRN